MGGFPTRSTLAIRFIAGEFYINLVDLIFVLKAEISFTVTPSVFKD